MVYNKQLVQHLLDLGVHIGTDLSHGYNRQYNEYLIGVFPYKERTLEQIKQQNVNLRIRKIPIIDLYKTLFFLKRAVSFIRGVSISMCKLLFYHPTLYENPTFLFIFARLVSKQKHAFLHRPWRYGTLTNYFFCFYTLIEELHDYETLKRRKKISFTGLFLRLLVYSFLKVPRDNTVRAHIRYTFKYWRAVIFLRYFKIFYALPDVLITLNPTGALGAIDECGILGIPVISTVDTNGDFFAVTYPLLSNDDSYAIAFFYFSLFMNIYDLGRIQRYRSNIMNTITASVQHAGCNDVQEDGLYISKKRFGIVSRKKITRTRILRVLRRRRSYFFRR